MENKIKLSEIGYAPTNGLNQMKQEVSDQDRSICYGDIVALKAFVHTVDH